MVGPSRRDVLAAVASVGALGAPEVNGRAAAANETAARASTGSATAADGGAWPSFQHGAANTGHAPDARGPGGDAGVAWEFTGGSVDGAPVVAPAGLEDPDSGGQVLYAAGPGSTVTAFDAATGAGLWSRDLASGTTATPTVAGGTVYAPTYWGSVYALDAATGDLRWRFETDSQVFDPVAVVDGVVYASAVDGQVYALDGSTGDVEWSVSTDGGSATGPAVASAGSSTTGGSTPGGGSRGGGTVHVGTGDGRMLALDAADGTRRWSADVGESVTQVPTRGAGVVLAVADHSRLVALDAASGDPSWERDYEYGGVHSPAVVDGNESAATPDGPTVYVVEPVETVLHALDARTGDLRWSTGDLWSSGSGPVVAEGTVYVGNAHGQLFGFDASTGDRELAADIGQEAGMNDLAVTGGTAFVRTMAVDEGPEGVHAIRSGVSGTPDSVSAPEAVPVGGSSDDRRPDGSSHEWLTGWWPLVGWFAAVPLLGPLVLGALLALVERYDGASSSGATEAES